MSSNYSFIHSYNLIAQTPLIHFQWRMKDATLRASEVKPKLDRFIIKSFEETGHPVPEEWFFAGTITLDYKMQIQKTSENEWIDIAKIKSYFNSKRNREEKRSIFTDCRLDIICHIPALAEYIDKILKKFFIHNVFGARQSKGFGGFLLDGTTPEEVHAEIAANNKMFIYADMEENSKIVDKLNHIYVISSIMKNGINETSYSEKTGEYFFPDRYIKGYAMREFLPENTGSDKAFIKTKIFNGKLKGGERGTAEYENFAFIRAMLGLADSYPFILMGGEHTKIRVYSFNENAPGTGRELDKFRSPVNFRIYGNKIYIFIDDTYKQMTGRNFAFVDDGNFERYKQCKSAEEKKQVLKTCPHISTPETFDPKEFLCGFAAYFEKNKEKLNAFSHKDRPDLYSGTAKLTFNVVGGVGK